MSIAIVFKSPWLLLMTDRLCLRPKLLQPLGSPESRPSLPSNPPSRERLLSAHSAPSAPPSRQTTHTWDPARLWIARRIPLHSLRGGRPRCPTGVSPSRRGVATQNRASVSRIYSGVPRRRHSSRTCPVDRQPDSTTTRKSLLCPTCNQDSPHPCDPSEPSRCGTSFVERSSGLDRIGLEKTLPSSHLSARSHTDMVRHRPPRPLWSIRL